MHIYPGIAKFIQARDKGLLEWDKVFPRYKLASVGVSRKLEVAIGPAGGLDTAWLVGEQDPQIGAACRGQGLFGI